MKKLLLITFSLTLATVSFAQVVDDNWPTSVTNQLNLRFGLLNSKWNKTNLTYYIYNTSDHLTAAQRTSIIQEAFQTWSAVSKLSFTQVSSPSSADIKLKWVKDNHGDNSSLNATINVLAHAFPPPPGNFAGEVHFNDYFDWVASNPGTNQYLLLHNAIHEIGHTLGIDHTNVLGSILLSYYTHQTTLGPDDILAVCNLYGAAPIQGVGAICSNGYAVFTSPYPSGTYTWTCSSNLIAGATSGNSRTFTANGSGSAWIAINVGGTEITRKNIWIGLPNVTTTQTYSLTAGINTLYNINAPTLPNQNMGVTNCHFVLIPVHDNTGVYLSHEYHSDFTRIRFTYPNRYHTLAIYYVNACGEALYDYPACIYEFYVSGSSLYNISAFPNPASNTLNITIGNGDNTTNPISPATNISGATNGAIGRQTVTFTIRLYNLFGTPVYQTTLNGETIQINVTNIPNGIYTLHVDDGSGNPPQTQKIVIQH